MSDIELVINIPEENYKRIISNNAKWTDVLRLERDVMNGTPLPKGHGDLKDIESFKLTYGNEGAYFRYKDVILAPTIIEADKE